jgi:hypothetical protein
MREKAKSTGVKSLSNLISSFSEWIETEILERQASQSKKAISVNATTTGGGCRFHGPQAKHTTEMCLGKGLGKRPHDQQDQRGNAKNGKWMNAQQLNRGRNFNPVRFNQDKAAPGHSSQKPNGTKAAAADIMDRSTKATSHTTVPSTRVARSRSCS